MASLAFTAMLTRACSSCPWSTIILLTAHLLRDELDIFADKAMKHFFRVMDDRIESTILGSRTCCRLNARKLADERGSLPSSLEDLIHTFAKSWGESGFSLQAPPHNQ